MPKHRLIFGCGYLGHRVAKRWLVAGDRVSVVTRNQDRAREFEGEGFSSILADVTNEASLSFLQDRAFADVDTLLFAVGYDRKAEPSINSVYAEGFQRVLDRLNDQTRRVIYISTTGVYGSAEGAWVDESTPPAPHRDGGKASLAAEEALWASPFANRGVALRLAGIYGPGRLPYLKQLEAGEPIAAPQEGHLNLIHVDDAATVTTLAADHPTASGIYCVSDGNPPVRKEYYEEMARLIGADSPKFSEPEAGSPRAARAAADKRISNKKLLKELGVELAYPSYREGLTAILGEK